MRFANPETGWAVLDAAAGDGTPIALVGPLVHLEPGERARVLGEWVTDSRFGRQVKVAQASPLTPDDPDAVVAYLKRVKHIGTCATAPPPPPRGGSPRSGCEPGAPGPPPSRGSRYGSRAGCTCCWLPTDWRIWRDGSTSTTATTRTSCCWPTRTS